MPQIAAAVALAAFLTGGVDAGLAAGPVLTAAPSRFANVDGIGIHYKVIGRGKTTLVLVHGWGSSMAVWRPQVDRFHNRTRLVLIDLPGHGLSDKPEIDYTMKLHARAVRAVLEAARIDRGVLVGHGMGALVIRQMDMLFPTRVRAVISIDGVLRTAASEAEEKQLLAVFNDEEYQNAVRGWFDAADPRVREELASTAASIPRHVARSSLANTFLQARKLAGYRFVIPLLLIVRAPAEDADFKSTSLDLERVSVEGGLCLMLEKPAEVNTAIEDWMVKKGLLRK